MTIPDLKSIRLRSNHRLFVIIVQALEDVAGNIHLHSPLSFDLDMSNKYTVILNMVLGLCELYCIILRNHTKHQSGYEGLHHRLQI